MKYRIDDLITDIAEKSDTREVQVMSIARQLKSRATGLAAEREVDRKIISAIDEVFPGIIGAIINNDQVKKREFISKNPDFVEFIRSQIALRGQTSEQMSLERFTSAFEQGAALGGVGGALLSIPGGPAAMDGGSAIGSAVGSLLFTANYCFSWLSGGESRDKYGDIAEVIHYLRQKPGNQTKIERSMGSIVNFAPSREDFRGMLTADENAALVSFLDQSGFEVRIAETRRNLANPQHISDKISTYLTAQINARAELNRETFSTILQWGSIISPTVMTAERINQFNTAYTLGKDLHKNFLGLKEILRGGLTSFDSKKALFITGSNCIFGIWGLVSILSGILGGSSEAQQEIIKRELSDIKRELAGVRHDVSVIKSVLDKLVDGISVVDHKLDYLVEFSRECSYRSATIVLDAIRHTANANNDLQISQLLSGIEIYEKSLRDVTARRDDVEAKTRITDGLLALINFYSSKIAGPDWVGVDRSYATATEFQVPLREKDLEDNVKHLANIAFFLTGFKGRNFDAIPHPRQYAIGLWNVPSIMAYLAANNILFITGALSGDVDKLLDTGTRLSEFMTSISNDRMLLMAKEKYRRVASDFLDVVWTQKDSNLSRFSFNPQRGDRPFNWYGHVPTGDAGFSHLKLLDHAESVFSRVETINKQSAIFIMLDQGYNAGDKTFDGSRGYDLFNGTDFHDDLIEPGTGVRALTIEKQSAEGGAITYKITFTKGVLEGLSLTFPGVERELKCADGTKKLCSVVDVSNWREIRSKGKNVENCFPQEIIMYHPIYDNPNRGDRRQIGRRPVYGAVPQNVTIGEFIRRYVSISLPERRRSPVENALRIIRDTEHPIDSFFAHNADVARVAGEFEATDTLFSSLMAVRQVVLGNAGSISVALMQNGNIISREQLLTFILGSRLDPSARDQATFKAKALELIDAYVNQQLSNLRVGARAISASAAGASLGSYIEEGYSNLLFPLIKAPMTLLRQLKNECVCNPEIATILASTSQLMDRGAEAYRAVVASSASSSTRAEPGTTLTLAPPSPPIADKASSSWVLYVGGAAVIAAGAIATAAYVSKRAR